MGTFRRRTERGASAVEFALVVPILLLLVFGVMNVATLFAQQLALGNAARQAARIGIVEGRTCAEINTEALATVPTLGLQSDDVTVTITRTGKGPCSGPTEACKDVAVNGSVTVDVSATPGWFMSFPPFLGDGLELKTKGEFRCEWS